MSDDDLGRSPDRPTREGDAESPRATLPEQPWMAPPADPPVNGMHRRDPDRPTREDPADEIRDPDRPTREHDPAADHRRDPDRSTREADTPQDDEGGSQPPPLDRFPAEVDELIDHAELMPEAQGGQAVLYRARLRSDGAAVVIKVFHRDNPELEDVWRFWRAVEHPNIIPLIRAVRASHRAYEIMPLAEHGSLRQYMETRGGRLSTDEAADVLRQIGAALHHIHHDPPQVLDNRVQSWVHQDVKPGNILVVDADPDPLTVQLADFGIARAQEHSHEAATGAMDGSYAAPEQFRRERSPAVDWWALGMTLLEVLTGEHPFRDLDDFQINQYINTFPIRVEHELVPENWRQLLRGLLTWSPANRWGFEAVQEWFAGTPRVIDTRVGPAQAGQTIPGASPAAPRQSTEDLRQGHTGAGTDPTVAPGVPEAESTPPENAWADLVGAPFRFADTTIHRPRELAALMGNDWRASGALIAAVPQWTALLDWSSTVSPALRVALDEVDQWYVVPRRQTDRTIAEIIASLNPAADLIFLGAPATPAALLDLARRAREESRNGTSLAAIRLLYESQSLRALARHDGWSQFNAADENWHRWYDRARELAGPLGGTDRVPRGWTLQAALLSAALDSRFADQLSAQAEQGPPRRARRIGWFADLRAAAADPHATADAVAIHALMNLTAPLAEEGWRPGAPGLGARGAAGPGAAADGAGAGGPGADGADANGPAELARRLRAQVDAQIAAAVNGGGWMPPAGQAMWPPVPPPVRPATAGEARYPENVGPHEPRRLRPTAVVAGASMVFLFAVLVGIGTALSTSAAEGALAGSLLLFAAGCLTVALPRQPSSLSEGVLGGVAGAVVGVLPAAAAGGAAGWLLGPPVGWPVFWMIWTLTVTTGAVRGAAETRANREAWQWARR